VEAEPPPQMGWSGCHQHRDGGGGGGGGGGIGLSHNGLQLHPHRDIL
jgi:hypothetical protein